MMTETTAAETRIEAAQKAHMAIVGAWYEALMSNKTEADVLEWLGCTPEHFQALLSGREKPTLEELFAFAGGLGAEPATWLEWTRM